MIDDEFQMIRQPFLDMLTQQGYSLNGTDLGFADYFDKFFGIPIRWDRDEFEKQGCLTAKSTVDNPILSLNQQALMDQRISLETTRVGREEAMIRSMQSNTDLREKLFNQKIAELPPEKAAFAFFLGLGDSSDVFTKAKILDVYGHSFKQMDIS